MKRIFFLLLLFITFGPAIAEKPINIKKINDQWLVLREKSQIDTTIGSNGKYFYFSGGHEILDTINNIDTSIQKSLWTKIYTDGSVLLSQECNPPKLIREDLFLSHSLESKKFYGVMEGGSIIKRVESINQIGFAWETLILIFFFIISVIQLIAKKTNIIAPLTTVGGACLMITAVMILASIAKIGMFSAAIIFLAPLICALVLFPWNNTSRGKIFDKVVAIGNLIGIPMIIIAATMPLAISISTALLIILISVAIRRKHLQEMINGKFFQGEGSAINNDNDY